MGNYNSKDGQENEEEIPTRKQRTLAHSDSGCASHRTVDISTMGTASNGIGDDDIVPTVFKWEHGGRQVFITGTFNNWERQIPMHRSGNDFTYV